MRRSKILRAVVATALVVGVTAGLAPTASSQGEWAGVLVFDGTANVGPAANGGPGLCLPGLDPQNGCAPVSGPGDLPVPDSTFTFGVPSAFSTPVVPDVPATCLAAGVADGNVVTPPGSPNPLVNCDFDVEGTLTGAVSEAVADTKWFPGRPVDGPVPNVTGPTCGATEGNGSGTTNLGNNGPYAVDFGWVTSAGGTLPVTGTLDDNGTDIPFVVLVQARALGAALPDTIPCVTTPATAFSVLGVGAIVG